MHLTHHRRPKCVELVGVLDVGMSSPDEWDFGLVPKLGNRQSVSRVVHCKPDTRSLHYGLANW